MPGKPNMGNRNQAYCTRGWHLEVQHVMDSQVSTLRNHQATGTSLIRLYWLFWAGLVCANVFLGTFEYHHIYIVAAVIVGHFAVRAFVTQPDSYHAFLLLILGINLIYYCAQALLPITSYR
jgi:hypothetical protein